MFPLFVNPIFDRLPNRSISIQSPCFVSFALVCAQNVFARKDFFEKSGTFEKKTNSSAFSRSAASRRRIIHTCARCWSCVVSCLHCLSPPLDLPCDRFCFRFVITIQIALKPFAHSSDKQGADTFAFDPSNDKQLAVDCFPINQSINRSIVIFLCPL